MEDPNSAPVINCKRLIEAASVLTETFFLGNKMNEGNFSQEVKDQYFVYCRYSGEICAIADLVRKEKFYEAVTAIAALDAVPRGAIPDDVYQYIVFQVK
jgi:hypothetical protein